MTTVRLTARYRRDDRDMWTVELLEDPTVHTYGKRLALAKAAMRAEAARWANVQPEAIELVDEVELPLRARAAVDAARNRRQEADTARIEAITLTRTAAQQLVTDVRLTVRDAADLLGVSPSLVSHLLADGAG